MKPLFLLSALAFLLSCISAPNLQHELSIVSFSCVAQDNNWYSVKMENKTLKSLLHPPTEVVEDFVLDKLESRKGNLELYIQSKKGETVVAFREKACGPKQASMPYSCTFLSTKRQFFGCGTISVAEKNPK